MCKYLKDSKPNPHPLNPKPHPTQGLVDLCLRTAALADPENLAWRAATAAPPEAAAARAARDRCYAHFLEPLRSLAAGRALTVAAAAAAAPKPPGGGEGVPLAAPEVRAAKEAMFKVSSEGAV